MHSILRLGLFLVFAAVGVGLAIAMATQQGPWVAVAESLAEPDTEQTGSSDEEVTEDVQRDSSDVDAAIPTESPDTPTEPSSIDRRFRPLVAGAKQAPEHAAPTSPVVVAPSPMIAQQPSEQPPVATPLPEPKPTPENVSPGDAQANQQGQLSIDREGDNQLSINIQDADIREVLKLLGEQSGLNILTTNSVSGNVSATMNGVDVASAIDAILKSNGYLAHREGNFVYVGTAEDFETRRRLAEVIATRVYRPNYATAAEIQELVTPLLTQNVGSISVTSPAEIGIATDSSGAGGDKYSGLETIVIRDYESVLCEIDAVVREVDQQPLQVAIEAMILSIKLSDEYKFGVDFEALLDNDKIRLISGNPPASLASIDTSEGGLKFGFMDQNLSLFIDALETIGDANVIASPRLTCLNKQKAQILIGAQKGYVSTTVTETSTTQSVEFLEVGTQLRLRPFVSSDGMIRMEVHPELSTGEVLLRGDFTLPEKEVTEVTTNIMCQDGRTIIIGGLIREELSTTASQIPLVGALPYVGAAFRQKKEQIERREIIVLITPRIIYEPAAGERGDKAAREFHHHQSVYADSMSPISKRALGRKYFRLAQLAWERGDGHAAMRLINKSIKIDPQRRAAIDLRSDIFEGIQHGDHTSPLPVPHRYESPLDSEFVPPWLLNKLGPEESCPTPPPHPVDPGHPGQIKELVPRESHE
ncbi:MAG: hypothetical protein MI757_22225 [Pirellulales bacterium]|nr:hypothetical protein [Pirellulales bacterium]